MKKSVAALAVSLIACLLLFQNCGQGLKAASWSDSNSGASGNPEPTPPGPVLPGNPNFAKGDAFNYNSVPNKSQMVQTQIDSLGYATYTGTKAIAINAQGLGLVIRKGTATPADTNALALEGCYALTNSPCALLASGNLFEVSSANLPTSYTYSMPAPTGLNAASLPFVMPNIRASLLATYNAAASPKALVISVDGAYNWASASDPTPVTTLAEARRVALERCELNASITPCTVFAENSGVVFDPSALNRSPVIDYSRTQLMTNVPGMKDAHFNSVVQPYLANVNGATTRGVIYIAGDGAGGMAYNPNAATAEANALNFCNMNVNAGFTCFRYAIDRNIQNIASQLFAVKNFLAPHCKSVPRANCAAHRAMGCAPGMYYTLNGALPALENCL